MNVTRTGEDGSTSSFVLDGKIDLGGGFGAITDEQLAALTDEQFDARIEQWKVYVQSTYAQTEPSLYEEIYPGFAQLKGVVVRLYKLSGNEAFATTYPVNINGLIELSFSDGGGTTRNLQITDNTSYSQVVSAAGADASAWSNFQATNIQNPDGLYYEYYIQNDLSYNKHPNIVIQDNASADNFLKILYQVIDSDGFDSSVEIGFCWGANENPGLSGNHVSYSWSTDSQYSMVGASFNGSFYVRGYYIKGGQVTYGDQLYIVVD